MCLKYFFNKNKNENKLIFKRLPDENIPEEIIQHKDESYYSPYCRRRPFNAQRLCVNCNKIFYSYKKKNLCSKECSFSYQYNDELFN